jgi:hypothetical protein
MAEITATKIDLSSLLPPETLQRLQSKADSQQMPLSDLVRVAIETYLEDDDEEEYEDTPDEKILEDFRQAWHEAMTGQIGPQSARELLEELRRELEEDNAPEN